MRTHARREPGVTGVAQAALRRVKRGLALHVDETYEFLQYFSGIPQNFTPRKMSSRVLRRTRKGAVAAAAEADDESDDEMAAAEADDENGDELPAAPARNAAEALRAKADLSMPPPRARRASRAGWRPRPAE